MRKKKCYISLRDPFLSYFPVWDFFVQAKTKKQGHSHAFTIVVSVLFNKGMFPEIASGAPVRGCTQPYTHTHTESFIVWRRPG